MPLNIDQKRFLVVILTDIEEHLLRFESLLQSDETIMIFQRVFNPFPHERRKKLLELIDAAKEQLRIMRDALDLPTDFVDLGWQLTAMPFHLTASLEECQPRRMKGFGDLDEATATQLSDLLQRLIALLGAIQQEAKQ